MKPRPRLLVLHTAKAPPRPDRVLPELPESGFHQAVLKGLSKDPKDRYPNCARSAAQPSPRRRLESRRAGRVRLRCPKCGKSGGMSATDYEVAPKIRRAARTCSTARCRSISSPAESTSTASSVRAGASGGFYLSDAPQPTGRSTTPVPPMGGRASRSTQIEPAPATSRPVAKTMIESSPQRPDERDGAAPRSRPQPTLIEPAPMTSRPVAKTMIEKLPLRPEESDGAAPPSRGPRQTVIERAPTGGRPTPKTMIEPSPLRSQNPEQFAGVSPSGATAHHLDNEPAQKWAGFQLSGAPHSQFSQKAIALAAVEKRPRSWF